jgi:hypothetical protein
MNRFKVTYFFSHGITQFHCEENSMTLAQYSDHLFKMRGEDGRKGILPGLHGLYGGSILIEQMEKMLDGSHGPAQLACVIPPTSVIELNKISERIIAAGVVGHTSALQGVSFLCRLLDESQKEVLSLRRRINVLIEQYPKTESKGPHSPEVCSGADSQSPEGSSPKPEGSSSGGGVESR